MESVLIAAPSGYDAKLKHRASTIYDLQAQSNGSWAIEDVSGRLYFSRNDWAEQELEHTRIAQIKALIREPTFYSIDFTNISLFRKVIQLIADDPNLLIDNDHGLLLFGAEFIKLIRSRPNWDWRNDTSKL